MEIRMDLRLYAAGVGKEARIVPTHHYKDGEYKNPEKITLELRCTCGNKYGATIHSDR